MAKKLNNWQASLADKGIEVDDEYLKSMLKKLPNDREPKELAFIETIVEVITRALLVIAT